MTEPLLAFENVSFWYDSTQKILDNFCWQLQRGQSWAILGPSGCGKTTLLHLMAGIRQPTAGTVCYWGRPITKPDANVGLMLQDYGLLPWYTVERNIRIGLEIRGESSAAMRQRSAEWLDRLGIAAIRNQYPNQVSGGQRQRIALARLLALESTVRLLDEPLSAVDELTRERLQKQLWSLSQADTTTTVLVTHNIEEAVLLADHILIITDYAPVRSFQMLTTPFRNELPARTDPQFIEFCQTIRDIIGV